MIDEKGQVISAERFINAAVLAGLSTQISRIIIDKAFKHFSNNSYRFSININKSDLEEEYLEGFLSYKCDRYNIDPDRIYLELVEEPSIENSKKMLEHAVEKSTEVLEASGAKKVIVPPSTNLAHLMGTARMGTDESNSVVDKNNKVHSVPNLYVVDGSSFTTGAGVNPTSTIMALALRAADKIWDKRNDWT